LETARFASSVYIKRHELWMRRSREPVIW